MLRATRCLLVLVNAALLAYCTAADAQPLTQDRCFNKHCSVQRLRLTTDGSVSAGAIYFGKDTDVGFFRPAANQIAFGIGGFQVLTVTTSQVLAINGMTIASQQASGNTAFHVQVNGARVDLGTGASDYLRSDGTNVIVASPALGIEGATGIDFTGVATASLPACAAGTAGAVQYDTTTTTVKYCNGSAWTEFGTSSQTRVGSFFAQSDETDTAPENANFRGAFYATGTLSVVRVACNWVTAGTGGTTGVVVRIVDSTPTEICSCTLGACTTAALSMMNCECSGSLTTNTNYTVQLKDTTDCTANPIEVSCNVTYTSQ